MVSSALLDELTRIFSDIDRGEQAAAEKLLPLVYSELRQLAAAKMRQEKPGQTLQPTALVHEAYLRLVHDAAAAKWDSRGHFFAAAAEAMRRILIEHARRKKAARHGGGKLRIDLENFDVADEKHCGDLLALDEALSDLERHDPRAAQLVKLRYFAGFSHQESAEMMRVSRRVADRLWALARAWLYQRICDEPEA